MSIAPKIFILYLSAVSAALATGVLDSVTIASDCITHVCAETMIRIS